MENRISILTQRFSENKQIIENLQNLSYNNMILALKIMKDLEDQEFLQNLCKTEFPGSTEQEVQDNISEKLENLTQDSRTVNNELEIFIERISINKSPKNATTPFLRQVWYGEIYGDTGYNGLLKLSNELRLINNLLNEPLSKLRDLEQIRSEEYV